MNSVKIERGLLVKSLAGHDKGSVMVVMDVDGDYVSLADGKNRSVNKPKRKKLKHTELLGKAIECKMLDANGGINDGALARIIKNVLK